jgi:hypothetical protein
MFGKISVEEWAHGGRWWVYTLGNESYAIYLVFYALVHINT